MLPEPRALHPVRLFTNESMLIDKGMAVRFQAPKSFTGEDVLELHVHGAPSVVECLLRELSDIPKTRLADSGEFSERAFFNNKMSLSEAEGLADLLAAETDAQRRQALWMMEGGQDRITNVWREMMIKAMALTEAFIDFGEDEGIESDAIDSANSLLESLVTEIRNECNKRTGESIRNGYRVAIVGAPNAGKSSLLNRLSGRKAAIVSSVPGTTRDIIEVRMDVRGLPVIFQDTAGLRKYAGCEIEEEGMERARQAALSADLVIHLQSNDTSCNTCNIDGISNVLSVMNKGDLYEHRDGIVVSSKTGDGIEELQDTIYSKLQSIQSSQPASSVIIRARHRHHLERCLEHLIEASLSSDLVLRAEHLRRAARELGRLAGEIGSEEVIDVLFRSFCIGK